MPCRNRLALIACLTVSHLTWLAAACSPLAAQDWARKMFQEFEHDFGTVVRGSAPEHRFIIENVFKEDIRIESVNSSCGCTSVSLEQRQLKTREKAELIARFNTIGVSGQRQATVTVRFSAPYTGEVQLQVRGNIRTDLQISPSDLNFGTVNPASSPRQTVEVRKFGNANWRIVDVRSTFPHIGVSLSETQRDQSRVNYLLSAAIKSTAPAGPLQGELVVVATDGSEEVKLPIQFSGKVVALLQLSPPVLDLANVKPGELVTKKVILKADQPFRVIDVTCENAAFTVQADGESRNMHFVEVSYKGIAESGKQQAELHFETDLADQPSAVLPAIVNVVSDDQ
jgi:hypothetical protein